LSAEANETVMPVSLSRLSSRAGQLFVVVALVASVVAVAGPARAAGGSCSGAFSADGECRFMFTGLPITVTASFSTPTATKTVSIHVVAMIGIAGQDPYDAKWECAGEAKKSTSCVKTYSYDPQMAPPVPFPVTENLVVVCRAHNLGPPASGDKGTYRCTTGTQI
jgi:hypothetical protein